MRPLIVHVHMTSQGAVRSIFVVAWDADHDETDRVAISRGAPCSGRDDLHQSQDPTTQQDDHRERRQDGEHQLGREGVNESELDSPRKLANVCVSRPPIVAMNTKSFQIPMKTISVATAIAGAGAGMMIRKTTPSRELPSIRAGRSCATRCRSSAGASHRRQGGRSRQRRRGRRHEPLSARSLARGLRSGRPRSRSPPIPPHPIPDYRSPTPISAIRLW